MHRLEPRPSAARAEWTGHNIRSIARIGKHTIAALKAHYGNTVPIFASTTLV
ncbi:MAG: hypothetical protein KAX19_09055 [Candidatus Brocadiae bacterium]|nr:hypothetical protein [Candidatus Brocadiia bacterium]